MVFMSSGRGAGAHLLVHSWLVKTGMFSSFRIGLLPLSVLWVLPHPVIQQSELPAKL